MSVSCVLVFPRLQSLLWVPDPSWCSPVPPWCSSDPSWCSPVPPWCSLICRGGLLPCLLRTGGLLLCLLRRGGLLPCLLRTGGLLLCLLHRGGRLSRSGGLLLRRGGLLLRSGGLLFRLLCLSHLSLHLHMDLALRPSPCSASAPPPSCTVLSIKRLEAAPWGGGSVTNPVCGLPPNSHQRSPLHHIDSHTTQHTGLHFPSSIALTTHTQLIALITLTPENYHTITITQSHTLYKPWTLSPSLPSIVCIYLSTSDSNLMEPFRVF